MKINTLVSLSLMSIFAVSCSHKPIEHDSTEMIQEVSPKHIELENKKETSQKEVKSNNDLSLNCNLGKDGRTITLQKGDKRCEVHYGKFGESNQMAWGQKTPSICDNVFENIKTNIEKGGFKCQSSDTTASL